MADSAQWIILVLRLPAEPSRHRVAVWRELRRAGAVPLGPGIWTMPDGPLVAEVIDSVGELARRGAGEVLVLGAKPLDAATAALLQEDYTEAREAEWAEFLADCEKYRDELAREIAKEKFTLAELEEEEQSIERLQRWHRALRLRDRFGAPSNATAAERLARCRAELDDFAERVYCHLGQS